MSGFYYDIRLVGLELSSSQLTKIRNYLRDKVRGVAAVDSGEYLRSLKTLYNKDTKILTVYTRLYYAGFIEGGNVNYSHHKDKIKNALISMGLKPSPIRYI